LSSVKEGMSAARSFHTKVSGTRQSCAGVAEEGRHRCGVSPLGKCRNTLCRSRRVLPPSGGRKTYNVERRRQPGLAGDFRGPGCRRRPHVVRSTLNELSAALLSRPNRGPVRYGDTPWADGAFGEPGGRSPVSGRPRARAAPGAGSPGTAARWLSRRVPGRWRPSTRRRPASVRPRGRWQWSRSRPG